MTPAGLALAAVAIVGLLLWVLNLVRRDRLYVGYGAPLVVVLLGALAVLLAPPLRRLVTGATLALLPGSSWVLAPFFVVVVVLVYVLTQVTVLSNRLATLVRELSLEADRDGPRPPRGPE